jgi:hypothetical protein
MEVHALARQARHPLGVQLPERKPLQPKHLRNTDELHANSSVN